MRTLPHCCLQFSKDDPDRKVSPSFLFLRGSESSRQFLDKWWEAANSSHSTEDGAVLNKLLHDPAVNSALSIQLLPEVTPLLCQAGTTESLSGLVRFVGRAVEVR